MLLLHGIGGAGSSWMPVAKQLASERRVIVPDLLGFGQSPWPDVGYTVEEHLDALDRLLIERGLGDRPLDVAGHSLGAILAAELAARSGRVRRLTLVSLPYFATEEEARATRGADYAGIGPVYGSGSKIDAGPAIGVAEFRRLAERVRIPAVAVGGITPLNVRAIFEAGGSGVAVIRSIFAHSDPESAARNLAGASER